ncbi:MAG TPA: MFS transporter, partial [Polyangia bacterium]
QTPLPLAAVALAGLGLSLAAIYPTVMHETPHQFGEAAARHLVGYQIAAGSLGIAAVPWLLGVAAQRLSVAVIPVALAGLAALLVVLQSARPPQNAAMDRHS